MNIETAELHPADALPAEHGAIRSVWSEDGERRWGEIVIPLRRGIISMSAQPSPGVPASEVLPLPELLADLARVKKAGAHAVAITVSSGGGHAPAAFVVYNSLRDLSEAGCKVIVHVDDVVASVAPFWVFGADAIVLSPKARVIIHATTRGGRVVDATDRNYRRLVALARTHTLVSPVELARWMTLHCDVPGPPWAELDAAVAVSHGFADAIGARRDVCAISALAAAGYPLPTFHRRARLAARGVPPEHRQEMDDLRRLTLEDILTELRP